MVKIFVGNVAPGTPDDQLREMFEEFGCVTECSVISNYAFVHMDNPKDAEKAIAATNNRQLNGSSLSVEISHGKKKSRDTGGPMRRGRGAPAPYNGSFRSRGGPPMRGPREVMRPPGFRPRPWEMDPYDSPPVSSSYRNLPSARSRPRGRMSMGGRPPRGAPRGGPVRGRGGPRMPPPISYFGDVGGMGYEHMPDHMHYADEGGYEYYSGMDPNATAPGMVYDDYGTGDYTEAEAYDSNAYYGDYSYDYSQEPTYASNNGARFNPYSRQ